MENVPGIGSVTPFVVSVIATFVYVTWAIAWVCPDGQEKLPALGGITVSEPTTLPFLPELNVPLALTGPLTFVLFEALGLEPPRLTQT